MNLTRHIEAWLTHRRLTLAENLKNATQVPYTNISWVVTAIICSKRSQTVADGLVGVSKRKDREETYQIYNEWKHVQNKDDEE